MAKPQCFYKKNFSGRKERTISSHIGRIIMSHIITSQDAGDRSQTPAFQHYRWLSIPALGLLLLAAFTVYSLNGDPLGIGISFSPTTTVHKEDVHDTEPVSLEKVLEKAGMVDKTVIVSSFNAAWLRPGSVFDIVMESFRSGERTERLLNHFVVVTFDLEAYTRCKSVHKHCFQIDTQGVDFSEQNTFMTDKYVEIVWRKIEVLGNILQLGYNFIFTDADIVWFRDPIPQFLPDFDIQMSCDAYWGNPTSIENSPNTGFHYVVSNNRTIEFYKLWYSSRLRYPKRNDQHVFNAIKNDSFVHELGLKMRFMDPVYFGGFCSPSSDFNKVCTMHANCCIGLDKKVHDLRAVLDDWNNFMALPPSVNGSRSGKWWTSAPRTC